jgi:peptidoglycan hydrolase-like protein with peptidoglycan-binding domain
MTASWRPPLIFALLCACGAASLLPAGPALALEPPALQELESLLRDLGFDPGLVDGVVDDDTVAAIRRYKDFASLPGEPEPSAELLGELRGVAAAFMALNAVKAETAVEPAPPPLPDLGPGPPPSEDQMPPAPEPVAAKVIVPPPPAPPKLRPLDAAPVELPQVATLPPTEAAPEPEAEAVDEAQLRIDAELAPYRDALDNGSLTRADLAKQFNDEGRQLLQAAKYDAAIVKFSVAIFLNPDFAGAYSNRGTAYQRQDEKELALRDFDKAKALGFGGLRLRDAKNPLK